LVIPSDVLAPESWAISDTAGGSGGVVSQTATATPVPSGAMVLPTVSSTVPLPPAVYFTVTPSLAEIPMLATVNTM